MCHGCACSGECTNGAQHSGMSAIAGEMAHLGGVSAHQHQRLWSLYRTSLATTTNATTYMHQPQRQLNVMEPCNQDIPRDVLEQQTTIGAPLDPKEKFIWAIFSANTQVLEPPPPSSNAPHETLMHN